MPKITNHDDGTKSLTVNSGELDMVTNFLGAHVPKVRKALDMVEGRQLRVTLDLVRSRSRLGRGGHE